MRVVILGNAGSGKTTLASWLAERGKAERLDLDTVAWEPHTYASAAEQEQQLPARLEWVTVYDERDGELGRAEHRQCFFSYDGPRIHWVAMPHCGALAEIPWP